MNVPFDVVNILDVITDAGFEAYIVGGCVRDSIMGNTPKDWDITTNAKPQQIKALFEHTVDTGIKHGTVTVVINKTNYEVTTYRIDGEYKDCRHPDEVFFTSELEEDLKRRDFTMNAIAYHPSKGFKDFFGGIDDIKSKIIRGVGEAEKRFKEDALRMLRAVRFSAQLGFDIEPQTKDAILRNCALIENISVERIKEEVQKLILSQNTEKLCLLWETGILKHISSDMNEKIPAEGHKIASMLKQNKSFQKTVMAWLIFLYPLGEQNAGQVMDYLKFDNKTRRSVLSALRYIDYDLADDYSIRKLCYYVGSDNAFLNMEFRDLLSGGFKEHINKLESFINCGYCMSIGSLKINGNDLIKLGTPKGKAIGEILERLVDYVLKHPEHNTKESLTCIANDIIKEYKTAGALRL